MKQESKNIERGEASIIIELSNGKITVRHGSDRDIFLYGGMQVIEGTWEKLFAECKNIILSGASQII